MESKWSPEQQAEHRRMWIEALRCGQYSQAQNNLKNDDDESFCCLGVACDVYLKSGDADPSQVFWDDSEFFINDTSEYNELPTVVRDWLGLRTRDGAYGDTNLIRHNDTDNWDFDTIAALIEKEPEGLIANAEDMDA